MTTTAANPADVLAGVQTRHFRAALQLRDDSTQAQERAGLVGIAVPWDDEVQIWPGLRESVARDAVIADDGILFYRHREPIGRYTGRSVEAGYEIDGTISETSAGRDAATLVRDDVVTSLSIGFEPIEHLERTEEDGTLVITHTKIRLREVSIVPHPAYDNATITATRNHQQGDPSMTTTAPEAATRAEIEAVRAEIADMNRNMATISIAEPAPSDNRTAGQLLRAAVVDGDETAVATLQRAYEGGTSADDFGNPKWAGDLTEIIEEADPLEGVFSTGTLPETGMTLEFGRLLANTVTVGKQLAEGDPLPLGNVSVQTDSVPVETYGGASLMSVQEIKRAQAPLIDMHLRAQAIAAGRQRAADVLAAANALITANVALAIDVTGATWQAWVPAIVAAVKHFRTLGLGLNGLILPEADWVEIAQWADADGRPMLQTAGPSSNVGTFSVVNLDGSLLQVPTRMVPDLTAPAFFNKSAIRHYTSPLARVTNDLNALDLTQAFSVYQFGAVADEIPAAVVPVEITPGV